MTSRGSALYGRQEERSLVAGLLADARQGRGLLRGAGAAGQCPRREPLAHLRHIFGKLGVSSRASVARALAGGAGPDAIGA